MPTNHPGTSVAHNESGLTHVPLAVTTHLLSINHEQLLRATRHPFLSRAAKGTLSMDLISKWLANDRLYLQGLTQFISDQLNSVRRGRTADQLPSAKSDVEKRLTDWLESALQNAEREAIFFQKVSENYKIDTHDAPLPQGLKLEGLSSFEALFARVSAQQPNPFMPWLEGTVLLWATEKIYYEAWSWSREQDAQSSPRTFENDEDGGAMRKEFIPNWSSREFFAFVEQIERILNDGVSQAVDRDSARWMEIKARTDVIWKDVLDAEEAFWPDVGL